MTNRELLKGQRSVTLGKISHPNLREGTATVILKVVSMYPYDARIVLKDSQGSESIRWGGMELDRPAVTTNEIIEWLGL